MEFFQTKLQGSIFTPDLSISNSLPILNIISKLLPDELNSRPIALPIPQDAPANFPRIQFTSENERFRVSMSLERTDFVVTSSPIEERKQFKRNKLSEILADFFSQLKDEMDLGVQRLAFVSEAVALIEDPAAFIVQKFCKPEYQEKGNVFSNTKKFEIHSYKRYIWNSFTLNSWVRIRAVDLKANPTREALSVHNDLNTLAMAEDKDKRFSSFEIKDYFNSITGHLNEIDQKYFPERSRFSQKIHRGFISRDGKRSYFYGMLFCGYLH